MAELGLNERQRQAIIHLKASTRIANSEYQALVGVARATATRDLEGLLIKGVLEKVGTTGKGTYYMLAKKRLTKASKDS